MLILFFGIYTTHCCFLLEYECLVYASLILQHRDHQESVQMSQQVSNWNELKVVYTSSNFSFINLYTEKQIWALGWGQLESGLLDALGGYKYAQSEHNDSTFGIWTHRVLHTPQMTPEPIETKTLER